MKIKIGPYPKGKKDRKVSIKIHPYDTWSMDHTLALIILPMLEQLQATKHGAPHSMAGFQQTSNSRQLSFDFYSEGDNAAWEAGHQQWTEILDKMIWSFRQVLDDDWQEKYCKKAPLISNEIGTITGGDYDWDCWKKYEERIQEGLDLFGQYYRGLWD